MKSHKIISANFQSLIIIDIKEGAELHFDNEAFYCRETQEEFYTEENEQKGKDWVKIGTLISKKGPVFLDEKRFNDFLKKYGDYYRTF